MNLAVFDRSLRRIGTVPGVQADGGVVVSCKTSGKGRHVVRRRYPLVAVVAGQVAVRVTGDPGAVAAGVVGIQVDGVSEARAWVPGFWRPRGRALAVGPRWVQFQKKNGWH